MSVRPPSLSESPAAPDAADAAARASFHARWLAEVVRRHEEAHGALTDEAELTAARRAPPRFEDRLLARARLLAAREGWDADLARLARRLRVGAAAALVAAFVVGWAAGAAVLGDGGRAVNVVWALGGVLGAHLVGLLVWLGSVAFGLRRGRGGGAWLARAGRAAANLLDHGARAGPAAAALFGLLGRGGGLPWAAGLLNHLLWAAALGGAAGSMLLLFATRRYGFVWETTILPVGLFVELGSALGRLPAALGFPVPDSTALTAAGVPASAVGDGAAGRGWAGWLIGCVLLYGVLPRLLLAGLCAALLRRAAAAVRLDEDQPAHAALRARLLPDSERLGIHDADHSGAPPRAPAAPAGGEGALALALELGDDLDWPPPFGAGDIASAADPRCAPRRLDSREQRQAWLAAVRARPPQRLLVAVDARQTPDRGSLGTLVELAACAGCLRVWTLPGSAAGRLAQWRTALAERDLATADRAVLTDADAARRWLETGA